MGGEVLFINKKDHATTQMNLNNIMKSEGSQMNSTTHSLILFTRMSPEDKWIEMESRLWLSKARQEARIDCKLVVGNLEDGGNIVLLHNGNGCTIL